MKPLLSICMMVKDEAQNLKRCLDSLLELRTKVSSELIIIDTGSTDNTVEIAKKYTDKIYFHQWENNFSEMRNKSIGYAKGKWIFIIDADEELESTTNIIEFVKNINSKVIHTGGIYVKNFTNEEDFVILPSPRLFKNDGDFCYVGAVHNKPEFKGEVYEIKTILRHYGYMSTDLDLMERKFKRTAALLKEELAKDPDNVYYHFQLSSSYGMYNDCQGALASAIAAYKVIERKKLDGKEYIYVYQQLAKSYFLNDKFKESEEICLLGIQLNDEYIDLYLQLADAQAVLKKNDQAISNYKKYFDLLKNYESLKIKGDMSIQMQSLCRTSEAYHNMAIVYREQGNYEEALQCVEKVEKKEFSERKMLLIIELTCKLNQFAKLKEWFDKEIGTQDENIINLFITNLEKMKKVLPKENCLQMFNSFSKEDNIYGLLNMLRLNYEKHEQQNLSSKIDEFLTTWNFKFLPEFYADIIYFCLKINKNIAEVFFVMSESRINDCFQYMEDCYGDLSKTIVDYLNEMAWGNSYQELKTKRTLEKYILFSNKITPEKYESIFNSYVDDGINLLQHMYSNYIIQQELVTEVKNIEDAFFIYMLKAKNTEKNSKEYIGYLQKAIEVYPFVSTGIKMLLKKVEVCVGNQGKMATYKVRLKSDIENLIHANKLEEAKNIINEYEKLISSDADIYCLKSVILITENNLEDAKQVLETGVSLYPVNYDLLYNLAYVHELQRKYKKATELYLQLNTLANSDEQQSDIQQALERMKEFCGDEEVVYHKKQKIAFFVKPEMDSFLDDIINALSDEYETRKVITTESKQIDEGMQWADICWFEWCDELVAYGSKVELAKTKKIICRLHSYEAFTENPVDVNWNAVDKVIFVAEHIRDTVLEKAPSLDKEKAVIIPNGIILDNFSFKNRKSGFKMAYVGYINYKKGPMLLLHTFKAIYDKDKRYQLYIAGTFQDGRDMLYFRQMISEMGLDKNVFYEGWQSNINQWLNDKDYIICTSVLEGHPVGIMEGMAKGIKPLIHNFVGARKIFPSAYIWNTIDECVKQVRVSSYSSTEYRKVIQERYSKQQQVERILAVINNIDDRENKEQSREIKKVSSEIQHKKVCLPKVSIIIPTYNRKELLSQALESVLAQDYVNLEIIVSDNASSDGTDEMMEDFVLDKRIKYHRNIENIGPVENMRQALYKLATGEYVLILTDDDYLIDDNYISKAVALLLENQNVVLVHANCKMLNMDTNEVTVTDLHTARITKGIDYFINYEQQPGYDHICGVISSVFNRKKAMEAGCLYEESWVGDLFLNLKMMLSGDIGAINDYVAVCRIHKGSNSNNLDPKYDYSTITELEKIKNMGLQMGVPAEVMHDWMIYRVVRYMRYAFISHVTNGREQIGVDFLNSIKDTHPEAFRAVRESFNM